MLVTQEQLKRAAKDPELVKSMLADTIQTLMYIEEIQDSWKFWQGPDMAGTCLRGIIEKLESLPAEVPMSEYFKEQLNP